MTGGITSTGPHLTLGGNRTISAASGAFTFCEWLWIDSTQTAQILYSTTSASFLFHFTSMTNLRLRLNNIDDNVTISPAMPTDQWVHLAIVRDASMVAHVFVNGVEQASNPTLDSVAGSFGYLGRNGTTGSTVFKGKRADLRVFNFDATANIPDIMADADPGFTRPWTYLDSVNGTGVNPAYPGTVAAGNLLVACIGFKSETATFTLPSGWTLCGTFNQGTGSGVNSGAGCIRAFYKIASGSESGSLGAAVTGHTAGAYGMARYAIDSAWELDNVEYANGGAASVINATLSDDVDILPGDLLVHSAAAARGNSTYSNQALDFDGVIWGLNFERFERAEGSPGLALFLSDHLPTSGANTGAGVAYANTTTFSNRGTAVSKFHFTEIPTSIDGTLTSTLGALTSSAAGTVATSGSVSQTLSNVTLSSAASTTRSGTLDVTLGSLTSSATGTVASEILGESTVTLGTLTLSSASTNLTHGALTKTLDAAALSSASTVALTGTSSTTLGALTLSSTSTIATFGTASPTLGALTLSSTSTIEIDGASSITLGALVSNASGTVSIVGASSTTLSPLTSSSTAAVRIAGTSSTTLDGIIFHSG